MQDLILKTPGFLQGKATMHLLYYHTDFLVHHQRVQVEFLAKCKRDTWLGHKSN